MKDEATGLATVARIAIAPFGYDPAQLRKLAGRISTVLQDPRTDAVLLDLAPLTAGQARNLPVDLLLPQNDPEPLTEAEEALAGLAERIFESAKPVVAVMSGALCGPALALALAADLRLATPDLRLLFPETALGLIPGGGLLYRAIRAAGAAELLPQVIAGAPLEGAAAQQAGLIDMLSRTATEAAEATTRAFAMSGGRDPAFSRAPDRGLAEPAAFMRAIDTARAGLRPGPRGPAASAAVDAAESALLLPEPAAIALASESFARLAASPERRGLTHAARAESRLRAETAPQPVRPDSVVLAGEGAAVADLALRLTARGIAVELCADDTEILRRQLEQIATAQDDAVSVGRLSEADRDAAWDRLSATTEPERLRPHMMAVVLETGCADAGDIDDDRGARLSRRLAGISAALPAEAMILIDDSRADLRLLAEALERPGRFGAIALPGPEGVVAEISVPAGTAPSKRALALGLGEALGFVPVAVTLPPRLSGGQPSLRLAAALEQAGMAMLSLGAQPAAIDAALRAFGFRQGPFERIDTLGLARRMAELEHAQLAQSLPGWVDPAPVAALLQAGRAGRDAGAGFLAWQRDASGIVPHGQADAAVMPVLSAAGLLGAPGPVPDAAFIRQASLAALANEGAKLLETGMIAAPHALDMIALGNCGFPRHRGGPLFWAGDAGGRTGLLAARNMLRMVRERLETAGLTPSDLWQEAESWEHLIREGRRFY